MSNGAQGQAAGGAVDQAGARQASGSVNDKDLQDLVAAADTGARAATGFTGYVIAGVALTWSLFQLYIASPLPFTLSAWTGMQFTLNAAEIRSIHLAFALFLAFLAYPAFASSARDRVPLIDWILAIVAAGAALYIYVYYRDLSRRPGLPITQDLVAAGIGLLVLLEATRRALGPPLMIVGIVFMTYVFFGSASWIPELIQWRGASFQRAMDQFWLSPGGVFGVGLGVSSAFVFLFVLFGSLLEKAGAGNYFIKLAFALLGHLRGGPAKAAVLASMMTGVISGSSIANVVTTGTFTIPLMKRVGFTAEKAGSVEVGSSVNGQIMPPVMGAAAFLMVEYVGISYTEVITHAFLPAVISYIALLYLVHLEAVKADMQTLPKPVIRSFQASLLRMGIVVSSIMILAGVIYFGIRFVQTALPGLSAPVVLALMALAYLGMLWIAAKKPDLEIDDPNAPVVKLPIAGEVAVTGLHYILPIVVLVWFIMIEQLSPGLSAFYAVMVLIVILVTQRPIKALFRGVRSGEIIVQARTGFDELIQGLIGGARNMIGIACAVAAAGIVVGTVTLTGLGQVMGEVVETLSGGNIFLILVFTALISLILGMGLPTTANYIVVATLMAPIIVELGQANGILIPLIAAHLFVFYFGIMADVTPPVGLASFAAAAVSRGDPLRTGFTAFFYSLRTVLLPFIFVFNTDLLLIDVDLMGGIWVFIKATLAMLVFAAATQGFFLVKSRLWESAALLLVTFMLLRPDFFMDRIVPPWERVEPTQLYEIVADLPDDAVIRLKVEGPHIRDGSMQERLMAFDLGPAIDDPELRYRQATDLPAMIEDDRVVLEEPFNPRSFAGRTLENLDFYDFDNPVQLTAVEIEAEQPLHELFYIPAFLIFGLVYLLQSRRLRIKEAQKKNRAPETGSGEAATA
ncbi:MAG: TRAP transporter permease [Salinarimonas sp.]